MGKIQKAYATETVTLRQTTDEILKTFLIPLLACPVYATSYGFLLSVKMHVAVKQTCKANVQSAPSVTF